MGEERGQGLAANQRPEMCLAERVSTSDWI
jgi:hypothetical protein